MTVRSTKLPKLWRKSDENGGPLIDQVRDQSSTDE
jgi:hypothetical protein